MNYNEFLMTMLLKDSIESAQKKEYDLLYNIGQLMYERFTDSEFDLATKGEYDCIVDFINSQKDYLEEFIKTF